MLELLQKLFNHFLLQLNENEKLELKKKLNDSLDQLQPSENKKHEDSKSILEIPNVLYELINANLITNQNCSILENAFKEINRPDLVDWINYEILIKKTSELDLFKIESKTEKPAKSETSVEQKATEKKPLTYVVQLNGLDIELGFKPYDFQVSLAQLSCQRVNNIICVRTGSGKTLIAAMICKYWAKKLGKSFHAAFIVPTRHLAFQQLNAFKTAGFERENLEEIKESMNDLKTASYLRDRQVVFLTAQKLVNALESNSIRIGDLTMLVFDECHHTADKHPYHDIMKFYRREIDNYSSSVSEMPLIVGLTASLGVGRSDNAFKQLIILCLNLYSRKVASLHQKSDLDSLNANIPTILKDEIVEVPLGPSGLISLLDMIESLSRRELADKAVVKPMVSMGQPEYEQFLHARRIELERDDKMEELIRYRMLIYLNLLYSRAKDLPLESCLDYIDTCSQEMRNENPSEVELVCRKIFALLTDMIQNNLSNDSYHNNKLKRLIQLILRCHQKDSRGLILMRTRYGVIAMEKYLNNQQDLKKNGIRSIKLLGQNNKNSDEDCPMTEAGQKKVIEMFRTGEYNLMVATDIVQEGLDVPECNYVFRYEFVSNEIGTVQSRGRARADASKLFLITESGSLNFRREHENREREQQMNQALEKYNSENLEAIFDELSSSFGFGRERLPESSSIHSFFTKSASSSSLSSMNNQQSLDDPQKYHVHCRNCSVPLFPATDLKFREPSYYSTNLDFQTSLTSMPNLVQTKIYCSKSDCGKEIGRRVSMKTGSYLYMIEIKGVKFAKKGSTGFSAPSKWSKIDFKVNNF